MLSNGNKFNHSINLESKPSKFTWLHLTQIKVCKQLTIDCFLR